MPAPGPSRPLLEGYQVAALSLGPPLHGAGTIVNKIITVTNRK